MILNKAILDSTIAAGQATGGPFVGMTDAQVAAAPQFASPILTPRTSFDWTTLGSVWGAAKLQATTAAMMQMVQVGGSSAVGAQIAMNLLQAGFNPQDPASAAMIEQLGPMIIAATESASTPIVQSDIDAIINVSSYLTGVAPAVSDVTASRARIAARSTLAQAMGLVGTYRAAVNSNPDNAAAAKATFQTAIAAL